MSETTYSIEHAKSGRAKCKKCKEKIDKGVLRLGVNVPGKEGSFDIQSWYHPECFNLPRKLVKEGITAEDLLNDMMVDNTDENILQDDDEKEKLIKAIESKVVAKKKGSTGDGDGDGGESKIAKIKARIAKRDADNDDDDKPPKKKAKLTDEEKGEMDMYSQYSKMKNDMLHDILKRNKQQVSGTKDILLVRCIDGQLNGRLGLCPSCTKGKLAIKSTSGEEAVCNGYYDEDMGGRIPCQYKCSLKDAPRFQPWYTEELTEEQAAQVEAEHDGSAAASGGSGGGGGDTDDATTELIEKAKNEIEEWDLESKDGIKKATSVIVDICKDKLDIPDDTKQAKMAVGKIITSNRESNKTDIMNECIKKFGFIKVKAEKAKVKSEAASKSCTNAANVGIYECMLELKELYFKEGNRNAGISYDKVANAIRELDYEITEDNAKGLGKGKTKIAGIGKSSADKIYEFCSTGTIQKLEEKRAGVE